MLRKVGASIINIFMQKSNKYFHFNLEFVTCLVFLVLRLAVQNCTWNKFSDTHLGSCGWGQTCGGDTVSLLCRIVGVWLVTLSAHGN